MVFCCVTYYLFNLLCIEHVYSPEGRNDYKTAEMIIKQLQNRKKN